MKIIELLIERNNYSLNRPFSYLYSGNKKVGEGFRVLVTFNHQSLVGYVTKVIETSETKQEIENRLGFSISEIDDVIDQSALLSKDLLDLADQIADYYLASKISVLQTMLPPSLSPRRSSLKAPKIAYTQYVEISKYDESDLTYKQIELLRLIKEEKKVKKSEIKQVSILNKLIEKGLVKITKEEKSRLELPNYDVTPIPSLTSDQQKVVDEFLSSDDEVYLLQGVTGSGKSEVYLSLSEKYLKDGKSVLMLVPEISLTPMMVRNFISRFHDNVAILHSELTPAEKYDEYRKIARGDAKIVVGARSAIFAPLPNIGLIILDEEHVESYKQDVSPFYHAKDVAILRAKAHHAKVLLGSATPSLESRARGQKGVYHLLRLDKRINEQPLPKTTIVNLSDYHNIDKESYIFSHKLRDAIKINLEKGNQTILLINRRGFSSSVSCRSCGYIFKCPTCSIPLTYHKKDRMLKCHHCNYVEEAVDNCPMCGSKYLMRSGFGTERIEEEVHRLFPEARTLRLDSDSAKIRTKISKTIEAFRNKEADILIGTQMIAKGHDFPDVTLVGVVLADIGLSLPSYRSAERVFELVTQAVGRCGRGEKKGEAIIQTYSPSHYAITMAARQDYDVFYAREMQARKVQGYPPYMYLASVTVSSKSEEAVIDLTYQLIDKLNFMLKDNAVILGPTTPYVPYQNNSYVRLILIKYKNYDLVHDSLKKILDSNSGKSNVSISINIDPYNL